MWTNALLEFLKESIIVDVAGILGLILSSIECIVDYSQKKKLKNVEATLKKEMQEADHNQETQILYLTRLYDNLPYVKEQHDNKWAAINKYKDAVSAIIRGENVFYANVNLGKIVDLFENLKPKLLSCIRTQKNTEAYMTEYLQVAREGKNVEKSSMDAEKAQCLRNKVIKYNKETKPPRKRRG